MQAKFSHAAEDFTTFEVTSYGHLHMCAHIVLHETYKFILNIVVLFTALAGI